MSANPFETGRVNGHAVMAYDAGSRIYMVRSFTRAQCKAALTVPGLQATVCRAIERRLRELDGNVVRVGTRA